MGWRGYIDTERRTVFFWSQKAACTTLFGFLADNMGEQPTEKKHFHTASQPFHRCQEAIQRNNYRSVILVRHPVTRAISAYFNKFCLYRNKALKTRADLEPFAQELHDLYCDRTGRKTQDNLMSFEDFLETVAAAHAARSKPRFPINGHWDTQMPPYLAAQGFRHDHVIHVERLNAEMGALADRLGMRYRPRAMNRTTFAETRHEGYLGDRPAREVAGFDFGYENFVTPGTLAGIRGIYGVDFEAFGYPERPELD